MDQMYYGLSPRTGEAMDQTVRARLAALGIPTGRREDLLRLFPAELAVKRAELDDSTLGEVLACFVEHGLIGLQGGAEADEDHRHVCRFYREHSEILDLVPGFFRDGLARGERCVWAVPDWLSLAAARAVLARAGLADALLDRRLALYTTDEVYRVGGELRDTDPLLAFWMSHAAAAAEAGAAGLRISGDGTWSASGTLGWERFVAYERTVHDVIAGSAAITALCTYKIGDLGPEQLTDVLDTHGFTGPGAR
jgi:hypothetical protein